MERIFTKLSGSQLPRAPWLGRGQDIISLYYRLQTTGCGEIWLINCKQQNISINIIYWPVTRLRRLIDWLVWPVWPIYIYKVSFITTVLLCYCCFYGSSINVSQHNRSLQSISPKIPLRNEFCLIVLLDPAAGLSSCYCLHLVLLAFEMISSVSIS